MYYINPYMTRISKLDCRSQRFNLAEKKDMGFPSKDGFWVTIDGRIEFKVNPEKAAEVFVIYNEDLNGDAIDEELIRKVILPNAQHLPTGGFQQTRKRIHQRRNGDDVREEIPSRHEEGL